MDFGIQGRVVHVKESTLKTCSALNAGIFLGSIYFYYTRVFKHNRNIPYFALFAVGSHFISNFWARQIALTSIDEACLVNNHNEKKHLEALKKI